MAHHSSSFETFETFHLVFRNLIEIPPSCFVAMAKFTFTFTVLIFSVKRLLHLQFWWVCWWNNLKTERCFAIKLVSITIFTSKETYFSINCTENIQLFWNYLSNLTACNAANNAGQKTFKIMGLNNVTSQMISYIVISLPISLWFLLKGGN